MSSSSSSSVSATTVNGVTRISGLSSGVDVDSLVEQLMEAESTKLNSMKQQQQVLEWKQEAYRDVIDQITTFSDTYLSLSSSSSILLQSNFMQFDSSSDSSAVTASATSSADAENHTIVVSQLATAATVSSDAAIASDITAAAAANYSSLKGTSFTITVDGTKRTVSFDDSYTGSSDAEGIAYVQAAIDETIGTTTDSSGTSISKVTVGTDSNGYLTFAVTDDSGVGSVTIANSSTSGAFTALGFSASGSVLTNQVTTSSKLSAIASGLKSSYSDFITANTDGTTNSTGEISFVINGKTFSFDSDDSLSDMMETINDDSTANVTMEYDSDSGKLVVTADDTGAGNTIVMSDVTGSFVSKLLTATTAGADAKVTIDGTTLTRSSNSITQDGVTYTLNAVTTETANVSVTQDADAIYDVINNFVEAYNTLLENINSLLDETYDSDYAPLTDSQEEEMSDTEISNWNEKAKTGLLSNDLTLSTMLYKIRSAVMSSVSGVSEVLTSVGITTSDYTEQGKLHVDADTLKAAIASDPEGIMKLFTKASSSYSGTTTVRSLSSSERSVRTSEEGIAYRLYDILQDYIGTVRDSSGNKGTLLEKYGMDNDTSDTDNSTTDRLETLADKIEAEEDRLSDLEDRYYDKFTTMETTLETLSSQYSIISSFASS